jgi:hypothetical protein
MYDVVKEVVSELVGGLLSSTLGIGTARYTLRAVNDIPVMYGIVKVVVSELVGGLLSSTPGLGTARYTVLSEL